MHSQAWRSKNGKKNVELTKVIRVWPRKSSLNQGLFRSLLEYSVWCAFLNLSSILLLYELSIFVNENLVYLVIATLDVSVFWNLHESFFYLFTDHIVNCSKWKDIPSHIPQLSTLLPTQYALWCVSFWSVYVFLLQLFYDVCTIYLIECNFHFFRSERIESIDRLGSTS